ncbi:alpha/beta hydrolase [Paenibacillus sp. RC67]|uniref:alpha/beta fold hydrolase n=1 Tax=Paenibacillus sp. RC67 TaxID=3039392 RepID=UPI0024AE443F|nr:alpha/beta hydrolase [Paenibacillus sp. RC67]
MQEIQVPCLVLSGQYDLDDFKAMAAILAEKLEMAIVQEIPDAGHLANMENPDCFNRYTIQFLDGL